MENGKRMSFWDLIQDRTIEIPRIQRDYIQYRETPRVKRNRVHLLIQMREALTHQQELRLNFIYGTEEGNKFIPVDGQQRLTTLWLLHLYIFANAGNVNNLKLMSGKLKYATRQTTQEFIDALSDEVSRTPTFLKKEENQTLSERIRDAMWFVFAWNRDPSVLSCLKMLDEIEAIFAGNDFGQMSLLLIGPDCPITFMEMVLEQDLKIGDMYIRMNSTGKPLTRFESFKAELLEKLHTENGTLSEQFSKHIDSEWSGFIWECCEDEEDIEKRIEKADSLFREIIHYVLVNDAYTINEKGASEIEEKEPEDNYLDEYQKLLGSEAELVKSVSRLAKLMDLLTKTIAAGDAFRQQFCGSKGNGISSYPSRVLLYGITRFAEDSLEMNESKRSQRFTEWWRILKNSVVNAEIDSGEALVKALKYLKEDWSISMISNYLLKYTEYDHAKTISTFTDGFKGAKISLWEDVLKQKLIWQSGDWKAAIERAESIPYFKAEIGFMLKLADIDIENVQNADLGRFLKIIDFCEKAFCNQGKDFDNFRLHRALLCFGDYSKKISNYTPQKGPGSNYLKAFFYNDTRHHNEDWRGMLRTEEKGLDVFRKLTEAYLCSESDDPAGFLNRVIGEWSNDPIDTDLPSELRENLIRKPGLFKYISSKFRVWNYNGEWRLLPVADRRRYVPYKLFLEAIDKFGKEYDAFVNGKMDGKEDKAFTGHIREGSGDNAAALIL